MFELIQKDSGTASRRRISFSLIDSTDHVSAKDIAPAGVKARITKNGGASAASTNDITEIDSVNMPGEYYLELTAAEVDTLGTIGGYVKPAGCDACTFEGFVVNYDPYADGASVDDIADAVVAALGGAGVGVDLDTVVETTGGSTLTMRQALQLAAALAVGQISGITAGRNTQTFGLKSATGSELATVTGDALGNRTVAWDTP